MRSNPVRICLNRGMDSPASRLLDLLGRLSSGRAWTARDLAEAMKVSERTVRRDVRTLRELGYSVSSQPGPHGAYVLDPGVKVPPLLFSAEEITVLVTGLLLLEAGTADPAAASVRSKLERMLPAPLRRRAAATALASEVVGELVPALSAEQIGLISDAVAEGRRVRFEYRDARGVTTRRRVFPYRHVYREGQRYLVAYDDDRADWRLFRLDRVSSLRVAPGPHEPPEFPEESIEDWLSSDFGRANTRTAQRQPTTSDPLPFQSKTRFAPPRAPDTPRPSRP